MTLLVPLFLWRVMTAAQCCSVLMMVEPWPSYPSWTFQSRAFSATSLPWSASATWTREPPLRTAIALWKPSTRTASRKSQALLLVLYGICLRHWLQVLCDLGKLPKNVQRIRSMGLENRDIVDKNIRKTCKWSQTCVSLLQPSVYIWRRQKRLSQILHYRYWWRYDHMGL